MPSSRYWPGCTSDMPTRARNGARMVLRAMMARVRAICARATSRSARARSTLHRGGGAAVWLARSTRSSMRLGERAPAPPALAARPPRPRRRARRARCPPRRSPRARGATSRTVPGDSLRSVIERSASTVPIDGRRAHGARARPRRRRSPTSIGSGWLAAARSQRAGPSTCAPPAPRPTEDQGAARRIRSNDETSRIPPAGVHSEMRASAPEGVRPVETSKALSRSEHMSIVVQQPRAMIPDGVGEMTSRTVAERRLAAQITPPRWR